MFNNLPSNVNVHPSSDTFSPLEWVFLPVSVSWSSTQTWTVKVGDLRSCEMFFLFFDKLIKVGLVTSSSEKCHHRIR